jgi:hypothetical protein
MAARSKTGDLTVQFNRVSARNTWQILRTALTTRQSFSARAACIKKIRNAI